MYLKSTWLVLLLLVFSTSQAGLMQFKGIYLGKNLFLENDFLADANHHCITNVYVNSKHISDHPSENIVELNLSIFKTGDTLEFRVYHKEGCVPKIVNKQDIEPRTSHFTFTKIVVSEETVHWETKGEEPIGKFTLEQEINGQWKVIQNVKGQGTASANAYSTPSHNLSGVNKYRLKYRTSGGLLFYSDIIFFTSNKTTVVFYPKRVVDFITFDSDDHREVEYTILDDSGSLLFEGKGILVDCRHLPTGKYYIIRYENKEERFYKKDATLEETNTEIGKK